MNLTQKLLRCCVSVKCFSFSFWLLNLLPITFAHKQAFHFQTRKLGQNTYETSGTLYIENTQWNWIQKNWRETYLEKIRFTPWKISQWWENLPASSQQNLMGQNLCSRWKFPVLGLHLVGIKLKSSKPSHTWTVSPLKGFSQESVTHGSYKKWTAYFTFYLTDYFLSSISWQFFQKNSRNEFTRQCQINVVPNVA